MEETVFFLLYYSTMLQIHYSISLKHGFNQSLGARWVQFCIKCSPKSNTICKRISSGRRKWSVFYIFILLKRAIAKFDNLDRTFFVKLKNFSEVTHNFRPYHRHYSEIRRCALIVAFFWIKVKIGGDRPGKPVINLFTNTYLPFWFFSFFRES